MENKFNYPDYKEVHYLLNSGTGYYQKQPERITFNKLPFELKVESTQEEKIKLQGATEIIHGRQVNNKYLFFTGLISINSNEWFFGNDYEFVKGQKKMSLVIFHFSEDNARLTVYYFNWYYIDNRTARINFVSQFANQLNQKTE